MKKQKFYDDHKAEMEQPEQVELSEILVSPNRKQGKPPADDAKRGAAAQAKANDLLDQIKEGASLKMLPKRTSDGPCAQEGGDLSYFKRGALAKELEDKPSA